ncbi:MAG: phosphoribosyltransferase family protein [Flavobacteriales bacterium]
MNKVLNPQNSGFGLWVRDLAALFLPRRCAGCDTGLMRVENGLCLGCIEDLPRARFHDDAENRVEQLFWGKVQLQAASSFLLFTPGGMVQRMLHRLKYANDREIGLLLGRHMAEELMASKRFGDVELLLPVPLHASKKRKRGYNQCDVLVEGMRQVWTLPYTKQELLRVISTPSQTRKGRLDRWRNVGQAFQVQDPEGMRGKHILLVDDVVTTGATLEGCIKALEVVPDVRISVCTVACA